MLSQILMVILLAILAYIIYFIMNSSEFFTNIKQQTTIEEKAHPVEHNSVVIKSTVPQETYEHFSNKHIEQIEQPIQSEQYEQSNHVEQYDQSNHVEQYDNSNQYEQPPIEYEHFTNNVPGVEDNNFNAQFIPSESEKVAANEMPSGPVLSNNPLSSWPPANTNAPINSSNVNEIDYALVPSTFVGSLPIGEKSGDVNDVYVEGTDLLAAPLADRFYYTNSIANVNRNASNDLRGDIQTAYNVNFTPFYQSTIYGEPMTVNRLGDAK